MSHSSVATDNPSEKLRAHYQNAHILIVDDAEVNLEVVSELLKTVGLKIDTAENGQLAVDKVDFIAYDMILMDVQMPEMDGLEATRQIRANEYNRDLPILAMTANNTPQDKDNCAKAGMNGFVPKPINPQDLYTAVLEWLPQQTAAQSSPDMPHSTADLPQPTADQEALLTELDKLEVIDLQAALKIVPGDATNLLRYLLKFNASHRADATAIRTSLEEQDYAQAKILAHTLKGTGAMLGLRTLHERAASLELMIRNIETVWDQPTADELIDQIGEQLTALRTGLIRIAQKTANVKN